MRFRTTKLEKYWILYDVGNSAFTLLISTIMPIYFNFLATEAGINEVNYLAYWGYAASIATLFVAIIGPIMGAIADKKNHKKPLFTIAILFGAVGCLALGLAKQWFLFLVIFVIAKIGYAISIVLYDSMLSDITDEDRMDSISSQGYAWGYIGSCIPFVACLVVVLGADLFGISLTTAMIIAFTIIAVWWLSLSIPLLKNYRQRHFIEETEKNRKNSFARLGETLKEIVKDKKVFLFLLAFFFYIDGVYTIIDMATAYGSSLGLDTTGLLLALLVTQIVAFPSSIVFGFLARKIASEKLITVCICAYFGIAVFAVFMTSQIHFWILAVFVGMFQGGIQALSRSYFTKIIPANKSGEYFGLLDICGKGASFIGTFAVSLIAQITGKQNLGVGSLALFFIIGLILFTLSSKKKEINK